MKNILLLGVILFLTAACSDILKEKPKAVATETFYNTASEIEGAIYAIYGPMRLAFNGNGESIWFLDDVEVDYAVGRSSLVNLSDFNQPFSTSSIGRIDVLWTYFYRAIRNANLVIQNAPNASEATQEEITKYVAEARFLRAFAYYYMVRNWGGIPLRTEENMIDSDVPRSPETDVYDLIVSDLEYAETNLPETQPGMVGRADKYAAKAVLTHVYLQIERWSDAKSKALEIINSGRYSLIKVKKSDDYYNIFGPDINGSSEEIFYMKYNIDYPNYHCRYRHHVSAPYLNYQGVHAKYADTVTTKVIRDWDYKDLRKKFNLYNCDIGYGKTTVLFKKFIDPDAVSIGATNDFPAYRYADILLFYAEADCRVNNGPTADGMEKLNMIHRRAYGYETNAASPVDFKVSDYNKESFINLVLKEGLYEQMDEAKRFLELKRTGKLEETVLENRGLVVAESHILWPIPSIEYEYNGAIDPTKDQNPGY